MSEDAEADSPSWYESIAPKRGLWCRSCEEDLRCAESALLAACDLQSRGAKQCDTVVELPERFLDGHSAPEPVTVHSISFHWSNGSRDGPRRRLVCLPGYGMGCASLSLFVEKLHGPAQNEEAVGDVHLLDWLGCGLSSRSQCFNNQIFNDPLLCEDFFAEGVEQWRAKNLPPDAKMALFGHSLGGYIAVCYAERYPQHVEQLILGSPCGVPDPPSEEESAERRKSWPFLAKIFRTTVYSLWERGYTPQTALRASGPLGTFFVDWYVERRFADNGQWAHAPPRGHEDIGQGSSSSLAEGSAAVHGSTKKTALRDYTFHNWAGAGSGEYIVNCLLKPGAWAKRPLRSRITALACAKISFLYGEHDWMDASAAKDVITRCDQGTSYVAKRREQNPRRVPLAGHQLFVDNPRAAVEVVLDCLAEPDLVLKQQS